MRIEPGLCYLPIAGPNQKKHLHVVLTHPDDDDQVIVVSISTLRTTSDTTVILHQGDHKFIDHDSVVEYRMAGPTSARILAQRLASGLYASYDPMPPEILRKIQDGVTESRFTRLGVKDCWHDFDI